MHTGTHRRGRRGSFGRNRNRSYSSSSAAQGKRQFSHGRGRGGANHGGARRGGAKRAHKPSFDPSHFINTNPIDVTPETYTPVNTFATFGLDERLVQNIEALGMSVPTPIQDKIIPELLAGRDAIGLAETGTGKTAAFLAPLITKTLQEPRRQTLILAPTRELAIQIEAELGRLSRGMRLFATTCVGGMPIGPQMRSLRKPNHFVIGTPGRVLDLIQRRAFDPRRVTSVVLDEADRMLDMGFINDMRAILRDVPKERETLFFSATMTPEAKALVNDFMREPVMVSVKKKDTTDSIEQNIVPFAEAGKFERLRALLDDPGFTRVIIFGAMKHGVERLARQLALKGVRAESIHGNKTHGQRQRALGAFKAGRSQVLVATDVAARGIHVDDVSHVINYDLPNTFEDYLHRIGRTGRGSKRGKALTFVPSTMA